MCHVKPLRCTFKKEDGFTLIEMLVSLFIFSLLSIGTMTAMSTTIATKERVSKGIEALNDLQASRTIMRTDFIRLSLRERRDILGSFDPFVLTTDTDALIDFTRAGRENPLGLEPRGDTGRVAYYFEEGSLIRRSWVTPNPDITATPNETVLFDNLRSVRVEFLAADLVPLSRLAVRPLPAQQNLPSLIRFEFVDEFERPSTHIFEMRG